MRRTSIGFAGAALACVMLAVGATGAAAKELKLASFLPPPHAMVKLYQRLADRVAKDTDGALTIKVFPGGALGAGPFQQYKRVVTGVADITDVCHAFHGKVFAKTLLTVQAGVSTTAVEATARSTGSLEWQARRVRRADVRGCCGSRFGR